MSRGDEQGAVLVETAILLPLLILLIFGIVDLGRTFSAQISLRDAVSEGALYGSQYPDDYTKVRQRVQDAGSDLNIASTDIVVDCPDPKTITVTATESVTMLTFVGRWFGPTIDLSATSVGTVVTSATCQPSPPPP